MRTLTPNITNRVRKLPKPSNNTQGLQPLFEAVSNAFFAIEDRFGEAKIQSGRVVIDITNLSDPKKITIAVTDNGIGLDDARFDAFCTIDTDFKKTKGGKGVGRLFWLDAFEDIAVTTIYRHDSKLKSRGFRFHLRNDAQIVPDATIAARSSERGTGTSIAFRGLRHDDYARYFPKRSDTFLRYFSAHFISDFLVGNCPSVFVTIDGKASTYPKEISDLVVGSPLQTGSFTHEEFGDLQIVGFTCRPEASTGLDGSHQLHLLANGRTVETRKVDSLLALKKVERDGQADLVFHGCVSGNFLDERVNEGRTAFTLPEDKVQKVARHCAEVIRERLLPAQIEKYSLERRKSFESFVRRHPIYSFDDTDTQLGRVPFHATEPEEFAAGLVKYQIRRDEERQENIERVIQLLDAAEDVPRNFSERVAHITEDMQQSERLALAQHVVRRKLILDLLDRLLKRVRSRGDKEDDHYLEETLHSFICPMRVRGDDPNRREARPHDLWIVDERFAFTRAFASDFRLDQLLRGSASQDRPDLIVWDLAFGMGVVDPTKNPDAIDASEPLRKVFVAEFKKPGRRDYKKAEDQIEQQITKYLAQLKGGEVESFERDRIRIADDCVFYCFVVADIVGDLEQQLSNWETTANGQGRIRPLKNQYRGSIEVIQWRDLVNDAWARNAATLHAAGLKRF